MCYRSDATIGIKLMPPEKELTMIWQMTTGAGPEIFTAG